MNIARAEEILGLKRGATREEVKRAFGEAVRRCHPDTGGTAYRAGESMESLQSARNALLRFAGDGATEVEKVCPVCRGSGYQSIRGRRYPCVKGCTPD